MCFHFRSTIYLLFFPRLFLGFPGFLGKILGIFWISWQDSWYFLVFSERFFCTENTFCALFQSKEFDIFLGKILQDRTYSWRFW